MKRGWIGISFVVAVLAAQMATASDFDPKVGNFWTFDMDGYPFKVQIYNYKNKVNGYSVMLMKSPQDPYGGGSYIGQVPGVGLCDIGVDVHDALTEDYEGIAIFYPPRPINGTIQHGDPVGSMRQWIGYNVIDDDDDVDMFEKDTWEVLGYEDVTVPYGTFVGAMKLVHKNYYATTTYVNGAPVPDGDWEFEPSCSEYIWWVPCVGMIKSAEYEDESEIIELTNCKVSCDVVFDPTPTDVSLTLSGSKLPTSVLYGSTLKLSLIALIENIDTKACHASETVDIAFYLQNIDTDEKMYIGQLNRPISKLAPGKTKKFMARFILSDPIAIGDYRFVAEMGEMTAILDGQLLKIAEPFVLLETELIRSSLPPALIAGTSVKTDIQAAIFNRGNVPVRAGEMATIEIIARSATDPNDIVVLTAADIPVGNLKPSMSKKVKLPIAFETDMPEEDYLIKFLLDNQEQGINLGSVSVAAAFIRLEMELIKSNLPDTVIVGSSARADLLFNVSNLGNIATPATLTETIEVIAHRIGTGTQIALLTVQCPLGKIIPGKPKTIKLSVPFSSTLPAGSYSIVAGLGGGNLLTVGNTSAIYPPADLILVSSSVPKQIYGYERFYVYDTVKNIGGTLNTSTRLEYYLTQAKKLDGNEFYLGSRTVPPLAAGASHSGSTQLSTWTLINPFDFGIPYNILAIVDAYDQVDEGTQGEANNIKVYRTKFMPDDR